MLTRIAPTPSGYLHQGNIYNFLLTWLWAKMNNGRLLLRIDDIDAQRKRPEYVEDIFRVIEWLGIGYDIGPSGPGDLEREWSQHKRTDLYAGMLNELKQKDLLYACACTRTQQTAARPYACNCYRQHLADDGAGKALKIKINQTNIDIPDIETGLINADLNAQGSFTVRTKNGLAAYQLASVADDRHFGVTHICRGYDLLPSSAMQLYLDKQLDEPWLKNAVFRHHRLLPAADGNKLSKSAGANSSSIMHQFTLSRLLSSFLQWLGIDKQISNVQGLLELGTLHMT